MKLLDVQINEWQKIGVGLTAFGVFFTFLGVILIFDRGFIAMGNILFLLGLMLMIGVKSTIMFFFQKQKWKGTGLFFSGFSLIMMGWAMFGVILEIAGGFFLFGGFIPTLLNFARNIPIIGSLIGGVAGKEARLPE
ncbi:vesicle transport protein GOT1A [Acrasis kona]|uniref:Vesicle transport protein GOT1A n=1 Tax=Acrasis kona TaxID=1008807 RepID=A0AAW2YK82_9EUKA